MTGVDLREPGVHDGPSPGHGRLGSAPVVTEAFTWRHGNHEFTIGCDRLGTGPDLLMLPALSSISTRDELRPLQERLASSFTVTTVDWPGFGDQRNPRFAVTPAVLDAFFKYLVDTVVERPHAILAAGHAAGYVLRHAAANHAAAARQVFLSPTWRGPLPTMAGGSRPLFRRIAHAVDRPIVGPMLYRLNVNRFVVGMMARGHVYGDPAWLDEERLRRKMRVTREQGARHGSARFVTGLLDPFADRYAFLDAARRVRVPLLNLFSANAPRKSRSEMEALGDLENVETVRVARGKLSFYEEFPDDAVVPLRAFLSSGRLL